MEKWYVVDSKSQEIITSIMSSERFGPDMSNFVPRFTVTKRPSEKQLRNYQYVTNRV